MTFRSEISLTSLHASAKFKETSAAADSSGLQGRESGPGTAPVGLGERPEEERDYGQDRRLCAA
jgi:hypothetical protein